MVLGCKGPFLCGVGEIRGRYHWWLDIQDKVYKDYIVCELNSSVVLTTRLSFACYTTSSLFSIVYPHWLPQIQVILVATEQFNNKQNKALVSSRIEVISPSDSSSYAEEVAMFLVDNPQLDKARIGEYIGDRKNPAVLDAFVHYATLFKHLLTSTIVYTTL